VVTPTRLAAARLRIRLGDHLGPEGAAGGIRVLPLSALIGRLIEDTFGTCAPRWSPVHELLLRHLLELPGLGSQLAGIRHVPGGHLRVIPTLLDLADAGFGDAESDLLLELASDTGLPSPGGEILELYVLWLCLLRQSGTPWQPLQQQELAVRLDSGGVSRLRSSLAAENDQEPELFVHGFYDFTDINLSVLTGVARVHPVRLYLPVVPGHGSFGFAEELLEDCLLRFAGAEVETLPPDDPVDRFFVESFPEGDPGRRPPFLTWSRAAGTHAEALSAAAVIRNWLDGDPFLQPWQILVVVPDVEASYLALRTAFADFHLPLIIPDRPASPDPGEPLRSLVRLAEEQAPADRVLDYLRRYPEVALRFGLDLDDFEVRLREVPFAGGEDWRILCESTGDEGRWSPEEREFFSQVHDLWVSQRGTEGEPHTDLVSRIDRWLPDGCRLPDLGSPSGSPGGRSPGFHPDGLADFLALAARGAGEPPPGPLSVNAITALSAMRARGITASRLVFAGLGANSFPFRIDEDPLLPDPVRRRLQTLTSAVGHRLAVRAGVRREMLLLFHLLNTAAAHIHWVIPEADEFGKATAPTPWVQRYLQRWTNADPETVLRMPRGSLPQAQALQSLDPAGGRLLPPGLGILLGLPLSLEDNRLVRRVEDTAQEKTCAGGLMPEEALSATTPRRVSVTQLETLSRCPFRFWATALVRLRVLEAPAFPATRLPLHVGRLVHQLLHRLLEPSVREGSPLARRLDQIRSELPQAVAECLQAPEYRFLPAAVRGWISRTARQAVAAYLAALQEGRCPDGIPVLLESKARRVLGKTVHLELSGRIDRLDSRNGRLHIVDYKTGRNPFDSPRTAQQELALGFRLQPLLYPWLLEQPAGFSFLFLGPDPPQEVVFEAGEEPETLLEELLELPARGCFPPFPNALWARLGLGTVKPCLICSLSSLCRRFDEGALGVFEAVLQQHGRLRMARILTAAGQEAIQ
jgi:hypothetical protein